MIPRPPPRLFAVSLTLAAPALVVLAVLAAEGPLSGLAALIGGAAVVAGVAALCWRHLAALAATQRRIDHLAATGEDRPVEAPLLSGIDLAISRLARTLRGRMQQVSTETAVAERMLETLPEPLLLLDRRRRVIRANRAARELAESELAGNDLAAGLRQPLLLQAVDAVLAEGGERDVEIALPVPVARAYAARVASVGPRSHGDGPAAPAAIVVMHDLTPIRRGEQMRVDFVANVSHELRTPLASLLGFLETLRGPARDDAEARETFLGIMTEQAERMQRLIEDLLSLSRIELDEHTRPTGQVPLGEVLAAVRNMLAMKAAARGMTIEMAVPDGLPPVQGDRDQLTQVFQNLIDNAIKYGRTGTPIAVTVSATRDTAGRPAQRVAVADRGDGIPAGELPRLTERFYRVDAARSREMGGTGLGLAIVKHIVNRHRGGFAVESELGQGSVFTVTLPSATTA
ncbi:MAG: sensor histidine kinase [Alphaproteobacteria bacterium]